MFLNVLLTCSFYRQLDHVTCKQNVLMFVKYDETLICQMIDFLMDNIYIKIGNHLFQQCFGIPMGTNCALLLANLFLYSNVDYSRKMF